ncbi:MAG: [Stomatobaculum sp.]|nr:[citrate (pro-3S)-lyase] ligase [Stomatobaculum sp.]
MDYTVCGVGPRETWAMEEVDALLQEEGIRRDNNLDYTCVIYDDDLHVIATGSCFRNTLRCFATSREYQGEGLLARVVTHLMEYQAARGFLHLFLYTKPDSAFFFQDLGFHEIARVPDRVVFMENRRSGFLSFLTDLSRTRREGSSAAVVMNANPFTLGHQYLAEQAAASCDTLHLFIVSEDLSLVPFSVRRRLAEEGTAHLKNVILHDCGPYIISSATFPSYFLKDDTAVIEGQARLDIAVFRKIAEACGITARWAGEEPSSQVTGLYNRIMAEELPKAGIKFREIPRRESGGVPVSASKVRLLLRDGNFEALKPLLPASTLAFFRSPEAEPVLGRIRAAEEVVHY